MNGFGECHNEGCSLYQKAVAGWSVSVTELSSSKLLIGLYLAASISTIMFQSELVLTN